MRICINTFFIITIYLTGVTEAAIVTFDSVTTSTTFGTPESVSGFSNGTGSHTFHNNEVVITSFSAGGTQYNPAL